MKWEQKMQEYGLNDSNISVGLKSKIKDFKSILDGIQELKEKIANPSVNDDVEELESELSDLEDSVSEAENTLIKAIELYNKNKDKYAELSKNLLKTGRPRKDGSPAKSKKEVSVVETATATPVSAPAPESIPATEVQASNSQEETPKEEKKSNFLGWALGAAAVLIVGVVTLGRVRD